MSSKKTADYAKDYYVDGHADYLSPAEKVRIGTMLQMIGTGKTVLDVGCYEGSIGKQLIDQGNKVYGIEVNEEATKLAREKGLIVTTQDLESPFQFEDNMFDGVLAGEILEHILDTEFFLDEIKRILKPGGSLVISTPNVASFGRRIFLLLGKNPYFEASFGFPKNATAGHIRFYTKELLISFLEFKGFKVVEYQSDIINFGTGSLSSLLLAKWFPTLGRTLIVKAIKP